MDWKFIIASILFGVALGVAFSGVFIQQWQNDYYKDASIMTCYYANNLTDIINVQSDQLTLCSGFNYTKLNKLNCDTLSGGK